MFVQPSLCWTWSVTTQLSAPFVFATYIVHGIHNFKPLAIFCDCTAQFVFDLVRNSENKFLMVQPIWSNKSNISYIIPLFHHHYPVWSPVHILSTNCHSLDLKQNIGIIHDLSLVLRKPVFGVSDQVRH